MRLSWALVALFAFLPWTSLYGATLGPPQGFVKRNGHRFALNEQSFFFNGANQYYIFYKSRAATDEVLEDAAALGLNVLRTWAFCDGFWSEGHSLQPEPGIYNEPTFENLDYAIYRAEQLGIRLVFSLVNNWDAFGGMNAYVRWSEAGREHDDFYSDEETRTLYKNYVSYVLNRKNKFTGRAYKDEPAILMWELANEPRVAKNRAQEFYRWVHEMAGHIKSIDQNHLVSTGSEGDFETDLLATHNSSFIDVVSFHLYPEDWNLSLDKARDYIKKQINMSTRDLNKPVYCGEFGIRNKNIRDQVYRSWYELFRQQEIDGSLFWILSGHHEEGVLYPDYDGFTIYYPETTSTTPIIEEHSRWASEKSGRNLDSVAPTVTIDKWRNNDVIHGIVLISGTASDDKELKVVEVNLGGVYRPATLEGKSWSFAWDSRDALDGPIDVKVRAKDAEDNVSEIKLALLISNGAYKQGDWQLTGHRDQDDGFYLTYYVDAKNNTKNPETGHFVARFYLTPEGDIQVGPAYDESEHFFEHPKVSPLIPYMDIISYVEIDFGIRTIDPGKSLKFKGLFSQEGGGFKTVNDWSSSDLPLSSGPINRVVWLKDGMIIAGAAP